MSEQQQNQNPSARGAPARLAELVREEQTPTLGESLPAASWVKLAVLAGLFAWLNFWQFRIMVQVWTDDGDWSHGFLIPLFSLYLLYSRREELLAAPRRRCLLGLPLLLGGVALSLVGVYPIQNHWISHLGMIPALLGLVLYVAGPKVLRVAWVPIVFLIFAMPLPGSLYGRLALPLQNIAAAASQVILHFCGVEITGRQSQLTLISISGVPRPLMVAEACSGMRMLMAFLALGVATAYLDERPTWQRVTLVVMAVPIAVLSNVIRVVITSTMFVVDRPELGQDFMHRFTGMVMLIPALLMFLGLSALLSALFVEDDEDESDRPEADDDGTGPAPAAEGVQQ